MANHLGRHYCHLQTIKRRPWQMYIEQNCNCWFLKVYFWRNEQIFFNIIIYDINIIIAFKYLKNTYLNQSSEIKIMSHLGEKWIVNVKIHPVLSATLHLLSHRHHWHWFLLYCLLDLKYNRYRKLNWIALTTRFLSCMSLRKIVHYYEKDI